MGARGPKKKLAQIELLEGKPGRRPVIEPEVFAFGEPFVPEHLHEDAQACIEVIRRSMPPKVYAALDSFLLSGFATAWAIHKRATHEISNPDFPWLVSTAAGSAVKNPWLTILREALASMMSAGDRLGLDPKSRAALKLPAAGKTKSKFDGLTEPRASSNLLNA